MTPRQRIEVIRTQLESLIERLNSSEFEVVHAGRWRHRASGHDIETGYVHGEGTIRVYLNGGRRISNVITLTGKPDSMDEFNRQFPVPTDG